MTLLLVFFGCGEESVKSEKTGDTSLLSERNETLFTETFLEFNESNFIENDASNKIDLSYSEINIKKIDINSEINISVGDEPKTLYLLFTNRSDHSERINVKLNSLPPLSKINFKRNCSNDNLKYFLEKKSLSEITIFNHQPLLKRLKSMQVKPLFKERESKEGETRERFFMGQDRRDGTWARLRKEVKNVETLYGLKSLKIWVSEENFHARCVTQEMVDALAQSFLQEGQDNDIYDWVTNIFGEEWEESGIDGLIGEQNEISILLTDIGHDQRIEGGIPAYFYAKDNYTQSLVAGSNERLMFYVDAPIFAYYATRNAQNISQKNWLRSVLAHEFEHMIYFYQKRVKLQSKTESIWLDEMLAVATEDLLATKLGTLGIRGIPPWEGDAGEYQIHNPWLETFNEHMNESILQWDGEFKDYSKVASFGAYLIRNYDGASILHNIMHNTYGDKEAIVKAVNHSLLQEEPKDFDSILQDWGVAVLLSSEEEDQPHYSFNQGDFFDFPYGDTLYSVGSINFFNYDVQPAIRTRMDQPIDPHANFYYKIAEKIQGELNIHAEIPETIDVVLVSK